MLDEEQRHILLRIARRSIAHGLERGTPLGVDPEAFDPALRPLRATFVTLEQEGALRGCIGVLEAIRPLVSDVAANAYAAAFSDPRFPPVNGAELEGLVVKVSVLSPPEPMAFDSEADLRAQLRPGVDGLILSEGARRGTFLPAVWESLPSAGEFLTHLKLKAGLGPTYWSPTLRVERYTTESFGE